jgi:hypothetical protein
MRGIQYRVWLKLQNYPYQIVYTQGISPLFMKFEDITNFKIEKIVYSSFDSEVELLTRYFIRFQRAWKLRQIIRRKAFRAIRNRELGLPYSFY